MSVLMIESCEKVLNKGIVNTSIVHVRNSMLLRDELGWDLIGHESEIPLVDGKKYDEIICMYSSPYQKYNAYLNVLLDNPEAKMFWLVNDHDLEDNILLRKWLTVEKKPYHMICNNPREGYRHWILGKNILEKKLNDWIDEWYTVNLNALVFDEKVFQSIPTRAKRRCIYYGTFRKHRIKDLLKFNGLDYVISSSQKNFDKFVTSGVRANRTRRLHWGPRTTGLFGGRETLLSDFKYSLYVEDDHTHTNYAFMANRFYECVMYKTLLFFHDRCDLVVRHSGYTIDPYLVVEDGKQLQDRIDKLEKNGDKYNELLNGQSMNVGTILKHRTEALVQIVKAVKGD